ESLVTYTNFPTTEYLELPFVDVYTFNVYLHDRPDFCAYLSRLQHLAGELPLVLTEFGMCSLRHGTDGQAAFVDWQIEEIFDHGLAGAVVFGWTDPFFQDECLVEEWGFGLVDAARRPKPSYEVARRRFTTSVPFSTTRRWPKISVVVATYNAARTLDDCLQSLVNLHYPDYEVIVVNDGSTDESAAIIQQYPCQAITTPNRGASAARNEVLRAAIREIVAYLDADARPEPGRPSVTAYWRQQVGYGESEALLERKHPSKFNPWGHTFWAGRIYAPYPFFRLFSRPVIYQGLWGSAGFQPMYEPGEGGILSFLPRAMEWHFALVASILLGAFIPWAFLLFGVGAGYTVWYSVACAVQAKVDDHIVTDGPVTWARRLRWWAVIACLHLLEPVARDWGRLKGGLTP